MIRESLHRSVYWHQDTVQEILLKCYRNVVFIWSQSHLQWGCVLNILRKMINMDLYGEPENELLGAASYKSNP